MLSARLAMSANVPARLTAMPEGCFPARSVTMSLGGFDVRSMMKTLSSGTIFHLSPSCTAFNELATSPSFSSGVTARLVGGPITLLIIGRVATMRGWVRLRMSIIDTVSLPDGLTTSCPASLKFAFSSLPLRMICACAPAAKLIAMANVAAPKIFRIASSRSSFGYRRDPGCNPRRYPSVYETHCAVIGGVTSYVGNA